jgi:hypothetical protein
MQPAVRRLDEGIVLGLPGEVGLGLVQVGPLVEQASRELGPVVDPDAMRFAALQGDPVELLNDPITSEIRPGNGRENLSRVAVHNRQDEEQPIVEELVRQEPPSQRLLGKSSPCAAWPRRHSSPRRPPQAHGPACPTF